MRRLLLALAPLAVVACAFGSEIDESDGTNSGRDRSRSGDDEVADEPNEYVPEDGDPSPTVATHGSGPTGTTGSGSPSGSGPSGPSSSAQGGQNPDACCIPSMSPGCSGDATVEQCVCSQDDYCCTTAWDEQCVGEVDQFGCGFCGGGGFGGSDPGGFGGSDPGGGGQCCMPTGGPGCGDPTIEQCLCAIDDYCCSTDWDDQCVAEVSLFGCGMCF
ncbi:MAG: hypothetical protein HOV80_34095 [Polyangiaceae bacterium]|nr:hypothetical protein [Polyangiaceae bacterium]